MSSAYTANTNNRKKKLSPINIIITPIYIGLRENLYKPVITNFFVGSAGDSVPLPRTAKSVMHINIRINPIVKVKIPKK